MESKVTLFDSVSNIFSDVKSLMEYVKKKKNLFLKNSKLQNNILPNLKNTALP